ncbi:MAG: DMT family transporter [Planctomycetia bacterium]|nr:DMT family transporter [Planctomycetia bacterium]
MSEKLKARLLVALAATLSSTSGFFVKSPILETIPEEAKPFVMGFWRAAFALVVFLPMVRKMPFHPAMLLSGLCVFGMSGCFIASMSLTTSATTIWLMCFAPFWVFLFGWLFGKEAVSFRRSVPLFLAMAGVSFILCFTLRHRGASALGLGLGVLSGLFFACVIASLRYLRNYSSILLTTWNVGITLICFLPFMLGTGYFPTVSQLVMFAFFGIFQFALPYLLISRGLRKISAQEGALITLLEPTLTPLWVWLAWGVAEPWWTLAGGMLVFIALVMKTLEE